MYTNLYTYITDSKDPKYSQIGNSMWSDVEMKNVLIKVYVIYMHIYNILQRYNHTLIHK